MAGSLTGAALDGDVLVRRADKKCEDRRAKRGRRHLGRQSSAPQPHDLRIRNRTNMRAGGCLPKEVFSSAIVIPWFKEGHEIRTKRVEDVGKEQRLRCRRVLKIRMARESKSQPSDRTVDCGCGPARCRRIQ